VNARHFAQPDFVDLPGRQARRRELPREEGVHLVAIRPLPGADVVEAGGQIFAGEESVESLVGRENSIANRRLRFRGEPLPLRRAESGGEFLQRPKKRALLGRGSDLPRDLRRDALHRDLGLDDAAAHAFAHQRDGLVHVCAEGAQPRDPILVILHRLETERIAQLIFRLNATALIQRNEVTAKRKPFDFRLRVQPEHVVVELIRRRERAAANGREAFQDLLVVRMLALDRAQAEVGPAVVPAPVSEFGSPGWRTLHRVFPLRVEQTMEFLCFAIIRPARRNAGDRDHGEEEMEHSFHSGEETPKQNGSRGSMSSVASLVTKARPLIVGAILPFARSSHR